MDGDAFLSLTQPNNKYIDAVNTVIDVINEYIEGEALGTVLKRHNIGYRKFITILKENPELMDKYEQAKLINDETFKERLLAVVSETADTDWKAASWLLERMYPEDFGKQIKNINEEVKTDPVDLNNFINAEYEEVKDEQSSDIPDKA